MRRDETTLIEWARSSKARVNLLLQGARKQRKGPSTYDVRTWRGEGVPKKEDAVREIK